LPSEKIKKKKEKLGAATLLLGPKRGTVRASTTGEKNTLNRGL